jgi:dCTP deaminase
VYLSDRDLEYVVDRGDLIVTPRPREFGPSGIDLHLDTIEEAKVWSVSLHEESLKGERGRRASVGLDDFNYKQFAEQYAVGVPKDNTPEDELLVYREGNRVILQPGGFFLWQTKEVVGTPTANARYICFINGKSTRARLGLLIHLTAPTIEPGWWGHVTLEIANLGPFRLALQEDDSVAQIVVAMISSPPQKEKGVRGIDIGQQSVTGQGAKSGRKKGRKA